MDAGSIVKGYELQERICAGGFGAVYRAFQSTVGREVAQSAPHCHVFRDRSSTQLWLNQRGKLTKSNGRFLANVSP